MRADLQRAVDRLLGDQAAISRFCGVRTATSLFEGVDFSAIFVDRRGAVAVPAQYEDVDVGDDAPARCLRNGLWLLKKSRIRLAVLLAPAVECGRPTGISFQVAGPVGDDPAAIIQGFFREVEQAVARAESYRGKVLSLEQGNSFSGLSTAINVHRLSAVEREQVILPGTTLDLLDRNVISFVGSRPKLAKLRHATKKGLLFYGPPGTGKTHTIRYLAGALPGHTTLLISAEQVALLGEYMTLARVLQPSMVVIEDVDLIARDRTTLQSPCEEALLNKLLNEMDGLKEDAEILFVLTTNRPEMLETALSSRPGRIDQAIEFPLPDEDGRRKLVTLYARDTRVCAELVAAIVKRTAGVSPAFIKELMRRASQFDLERAASENLELADVEQALGEMLFIGGSLNRKLLGAEGHEAMAGGDNCGNSVVRNV